MSIYNSILNNVYGQIQNPLSLCMPLSDFYKEHANTIVYPAAVVAFDITNLTQNNQENGYHAGNTIIYHLLTTMQLILGPDAYYMHDYDAKLIAVCPTYDVKTLARLAQQIQAEIPNVVFGMGEAYSSFSINSAIEEAVESARIQQVLNPNSKKHEPLHILQNMIQQLDKELDSHVKRTQALSIKLADKLTLSFLEKSQLQLICVLHDVGKLFVPREILFKPSALTKDEMKIMQKHASEGSDFLQKLPSFSSLSLFVKYHHEKWDGTGYPDGLSGHTIPLLSRIVSLVDSYDAMSNDRVYRKALPERKIVQELFENAGTQFDPHLADILISMIENGELPREVLPCNS